MSTFVTTAYNVRAWQIKPRDRVALQGGWGTVLRVQRHTDPIPNRWPLDGWQPPPVIQIWFRPDGSTRTSDWRLPPRAVFPLGTVKQWLEGEDEHDA